MIARMIVVLLFVGVALGGVASFPLDKSRGASEGYGYGYVRHASFDGPANAKVKIAQLVAGEHIVKLPGGLYTIQVRDGLQCVMYLSTYRRDHVELECNFP